MKWRPGERLVRYRSVTSVPLGAWWSSPTGTVTFLFTDLEGSTRLWEKHDSAMRAAVLRHDEILRGAIESHRGFVFSPMGDGMAAAFGSASAAVAAALDAQRGLVAEQWGATGALRARMGLATGDAVPQNGQYLDRTVNRCARLMAIAHGGQVLVSGSTRALLGDVAETGYAFSDLGEHRLRDLATPERVFQLCASDIMNEFPPLATGEAPSGNLPASVSSFIGREDDFVQVADLLGHSRIVTLTGVGGVGKTRLALQVASELQPRFRNGAWLVELAGVRDGAAVVEAVAAVFTVHPSPETGLSQALAESLGSKQLLLVVDNCEHLLDAAATLIRDLVESCPGVCVLATSREGLGITGERLVGLRSLTQPTSSDPQAVRSSEAGRLFIDRATAVKSDFEASEGNAAAICDVVRRLDGIPLAIELAAARSAVLSPTQIAQRLDQRFRFLAGGDRGAVERHATLRAAIDWSFGLLEPNEQLLLTRLSIFSGGCTLEAAEQVCSDGANGPIDEVDVLDLLSSLVAQSLVVADDADPTAHRYRLLETIRQYAEEHLEPSARDQSSARHAHYYTAVVESALRGARGPGPRPWLRRVELEVENVRAAMAAAVSAGDIDLAITLTQAVDVPLLFLPIGTAVYAYADDVLALAEWDEGCYPLAFAGAAWAALSRREPERAESLIERMLTAEPEPSPAREGLGSRHAGTHRRRRRRHSGRDRTHRRGHPGRRRIRPLRQCMAALHAHVDASDGR